MTEEQRIKNCIIGNIKDLVSSLCYYDRKDDEDLDRDMFEAAINNKVITLDEIIEIFSTELKENYPNL